MFNCDLICVKKNKADSEALSAAREAIADTLRRQAVSLCELIEAAPGQLARTATERMRTQRTELFLIAGALDSTGDEGFRRTFCELIRKLESLVTAGEGHKELSPRLKINALSTLSGGRGYCFRLDGTRFVVLPQETGDDLPAMIADAVTKAEEIFERLRERYPDGVAFYDKKGNEADASQNGIAVIEEIAPPAKQGFFKSFIPLKEDSPKLRSRKIVVLVAIAVFIGALIYVLDFFIFGPMQNNAVTGEIQEIAYSRSESSDDAADEDAPTQDWDALKEVNDEIVGWITIPDTVIDYPVLEHEGDDRYNQYYIKRTYKKERSEYGSIFIDYRSTDSVNSRNVIMHGHDMNDGSMFAGLLKYSPKGDLKGDLDYYRDHPVIIFNTPEGDAKYKIISVFKTSTRYEHGEFFNYMQGEFNSDAEFMNFVYNMRIRSFFDIPVTVNENDRIITLSTCCYEFYEWRCVVVARKVRPGEDENVDVALASRNPSPLFPDVYYERYGGTRPDPGTFKTANAKGKVSWYDGQGNLEGSEDLTATLAANPTEPPTEKPKPGETRVTEPPYTVYYPVTFRNYDGSQFAAYNVKQGDPLPIPEGKTTMPEDELYTYEFACWNLEIEGVDMNAVNIGLDIYPIFNSIPK